MPAAGKYGRLPRDHSRHALTFEDYVTDSLEAAPPADVDRCSEVTNWPMYVNGPDPGNPPYCPDGLGDCTVAGIFHCIGAMSVYAGWGEALFTPAEAVRVYSAVSGYVPGDASTDNGATLQSVLEYGRQTGFTDATGKVHTIAAYAALRSPTDQDLLAQCLWTFGAVYAGGQLPQSAETEFPGLWAYVPGSPDAGGHCTAFQRRGWGGTGVNTYISWAQAVKATRAFTWHYLSPAASGEAWVLATHDWIDAKGTTVTGLSWDQLLADMSAVR